MENNNQKALSLHMIMVPSPGMGHLIPLVELAKFIVHHHNYFTITILIPTTGPPPEPQETLLQSLPNSINYIFLPPVDFHDLPQETKTETKIALSVTRSLPSIRNVFESLATNSHVVALVADVFGIDAFEVAKEFNVPSYLFWSSMAMGLILLLHMPKLDKMVTCAYKDLAEPVKVLGCSPIPGADFPELFHDRNSEIYKWFLQYGTRVGAVKGIIVNTFMELEPDVIKALQNDIGFIGPTIYPIGPLVQTNVCNRASGHECLNWLDEQPRGSVLFVSFGSGGTLSCEQLDELALGLELSGAKFMWVVKSPDNKASNASYFSVQSQTDPLGFFPKGFVERMKLGQGLLVPSWAPQSEVLRHGSVGGFLSHCGWNSTLESIVNGVPLIAWPLYAEQKMNANFLCEDLKVALRPKVNETGIIERDEISGVVNELMEGGEGFGIRDRVIRWKEIAKRVLSEEGSSRKVLSELAIKLEES